MRKVIVALVVSFVVCTAQAGLHPDFDVKKNRQARANIQKLLELYGRFLDYHVQKDFSYSYIMEKQKRSLPALITLIPKLDIELSLAEITRNYETFKVIQLRKINSRTLLIGCGNRPVGGLSRPNTLYEERSEEREAHAHEGMVTLDLILGANPTIIGVFGTEKLSVFSDHSFDRIIDETRSGDLESTEFGISEYKRLLSRNGRIYLDYNDDGPVRTSIAELERFRDHKARLLKALNQATDTFREKLEEKAKKGAVELVDQLGYDRLRAGFKRFLEKRNWVTPEESWDKTFEKVLFDKAGGKKTPLTDRESRLIRWIALEEGLI